MMRFYVSDSQLSSQFIVDKIDARARELLNQRGLINADGNQIAVNAATGLPDPNAQATDTWAVPNQRADGKWIVPHPESSRYTAEQVAYVTQDLGASIIENYDEAWFPIPSKA